MKLKSILAACVAAVAFASCDDGGNEYHSTYFYPMTYEGIVTYADQTVDSTHVVSYDSWTLTNNCEWFDIYTSGIKAPLDVKIPAGYMGLNRLDIYLQPNNTGKVRGERISVVSAFEKIGTISQSIIQYPYLNISVPAVKSTSVDNETTYSFDLNINAKGMGSNNQKPIISFTVYADGAELSSDQTWIEPSKTENFTKYVTQTINLNVEENPTKADRTASLKLTSKGITTVINVTQSAI